MPTSRPTKHGGFGQGGIEVIDHQTGDSVELEVRFPHGVHVMSMGDRRTVIEIHMPRQGKVRLHTGDGEIQVRDLKGQMDLESGDGRLEVEGVDGTLRAHSGDGHVRVRGRFDSLDISTSDGRNEAEALTGRRSGKAGTFRPETRRLHDGSGQPCSGPGTAHRRRAHHARCPDLGRGQVRFEQSSREA